MEPEEEDVGTRTCHVCWKILSRKQRLDSHLFSCHNIKEHSPKKYKRYENDPNIPLPRTTRYNQQKKLEKLDHCSHDQGSQDTQISSLGTNDDISTGLNSSGTEEGNTLSSLTTEKQIDTSDISLDEASGGPDYQDSNLVDGHRIFAPFSEIEFSNQHGLNAGSADEPGKQYEEIFYANDSFHDNSYVSSAESDTSSEFDENESSSESSDLDSTEDGLVRNKPKEKPVLSEFDEKCMALLSFVLKHHLSWQASRDFMELFSILNSQKDITLDKIKQRVGLCQPDIIDFCEKCYTLFPEDEGTVVCSQNGCGSLRFKGSSSKQSAKNRKSYFVCLPLHGQIKDILEKDGIWQCMTNYRRKCRDSNSLNDILNGEVYKKLSAAGNVLESENTISLIFNTDGVPLYKSSGVSIWPVYLVINELPPMMRFSRKNMLLWGIWQAQGKPMFQTFFQPFVKQMNELKNEGITVKLDSSDTLIKVVLIAGTLDLQAKAIVAEMTQHNGQYGCITCEEPGEVVKHGKGHCRVYPCREFAATQRTSSGILQNGLEAMDYGGSRGNTVKGIKAISCLHGMNWFDLVIGLVPDYMHGALLGVTKKMLQLLFSSSNSSKPFFIGKHIKDIDLFLKKMKPTDDITRLPRQLEKNLHHLKASELQVWLLFYSLPCLMDFMKPEFLDHLALMVEGLYTLLGDDIRESQLARADRVLSEFYHLFADLYGYDNCTLNLHNVGQHLTMYVRNLGPVWAWSCFPFEDMNGSVLEYAHGTGDVCLQILWTIQAQKRLAIDAPLISNECLRNYVQKMIKTRRIAKVKTEAINCQIAGGLKPLVLSPELLQTLKREVGISGDAEVGQLSKALRVLKDDTLFFCQEYSRMKKRIAYFVLVRNNGNGAIAKIHYFVYHHQSKMCFAVVSFMEMAENSLLHPLVNHLICLRRDVNEEQNIHLIRIDQIQEKMLLIDGNTNYCCVCRLPNLYGQCA